MYNVFFGFTESPFQLVPNPAYLFLSKCHEEALAHLVYAISHGDGFVVLTGEVGTGKTTICRAFLETLDQNTEAAYIFNPKLDSTQLLKAINDEFGISSEADNTKELIDSMNSFLMKKKAENKTVLLLIDEAQNLTKEVLEQLRLLSNLETNTRKLLQIILVGQPELREMLNAHELRQLRQRIALSCHLTPLTFKETKEYILHRIRAASRRPGVKFTQGAFRSIYNYSGGIPRVINIVCDRALLTAFGYNQLKVNRSIAKGAVQELVGEKGEATGFLRHGKRPVFILFVVCLTLLAIGFLHPLDLEKRLYKMSTKGKKIQNYRANRPETSKLLIIPDTTDEFKPDRPGTEQTISIKSEPEKRPLTDLGNFLQSLNPLASRQAAFKITMNLWGIENEIQFVDNPVNNHNFFRIAAEQNGLLVRKFEGSLRLLGRINLPAILEFNPLGKMNPKYLTLCKISKEKVTLKGGEQDNTIEVKPGELELFWSGVAFVPWKNFFSIPGTIPATASKDSIIALKMFLTDIGFTKIDNSPYYDERTKEVIKTIQRKYGIQVDGVVGATTKIVLANENASLPLPRIVEN